MYNNSFINKILIVASVLFLYSCDKDYNSIGDGLLGENHFELKNEFFNVLAYNQKTAAVQSNNLPVNALGIYDNPSFGVTTANFATQLALESINPTIGKNPEIESVVLTIPYFSTLKSTDTNGDHVYELDSIYGPSNAKIKLSVYESGYFMRDLDPNTGFQETQKYFTDQNADFDNLKGPTPSYSGRLNDENVTQNDAFFFDASEYKETVTTTDGKETTNRTPPGVRLNLNKDFFKTKIIDGAASGKLATNDVFKNYFRGLYFKVEKSGGSPGALAMLNFKLGKITIKYKEDISDTDNTRVDQEIVLNMIGNTVSLLNNDFASSGLEYGALPNKGNDVDGDEKLYLKGGDGSMAILNLFNTPGELESLRTNGWLVNEANLVFHVDGAAMANSKEPMRVYLFDLDNNAPLGDYFLDTSTGSNSKNGKIVFGGLLDNTKSGDVIYKIRITNHIRNLIKNKDAKNVNLGLVVTEDINSTAFSKLRTAISPLFQVPQASIMNPLGTILYGSNSAVPDAKRLKLEIYYTKPN